MTDIKYTSVHKGEMMFPGIDAEKILFHEAKAAEPNSFGPGSLRRCSYCGSMHPSDVVEALKAGARMEWADFKYGWPHKIYLDNIPNPHAGLPESLHGTSTPQGPDWFQLRENFWIAPPQPAPAKTRAKFYTIHLKDATPEEKEFIEEHAGIRIRFDDDGGIGWSKYKK